MSSPRFRNLGAVFLALATTVPGEPVFSNQQVDDLKARYIVRRPTRLAPRYPSEWDRKPFEVPDYVAWMLPYQEWAEEYRAYSMRHYHEPTTELKPTLICMHYTVVDDAQAVWNGFRRGCQMSAGKGSVFGHVSVHLMIDKDGTVYQLLPFDHRCTGAYGVNHRALSIEMVASSEADLLSRPQQVWASFCVVRDLMKRFDIAPRGVIGHSDVSLGKSVVPEYLDYADKEVPDRYPSKYHRSDPGSTYMSWLRSFIQKNPP